MASLSQNFRRNAAHDFRVIASVLSRVYRVGRKAMRNTLRFANLLEPDLPYMVLSLSKMSVWLTLGLTIYVVKSGMGLEEIGGSLVANVGSLGNYAYRRRVQERSRRGGYHSRYDDPCDEDYSDMSDMGDFDPNLPTPAGRML